ncbi:hypothetical protein DFJ74DRAFT_646649 [Hyaloraphidium curvatum]|nr:hypothetical protein DFJ74DRAFT_646649 [Hyaloraphidium curvatum]
MKTFSQTSTGPARRRRGPAGAAEPARPSTALSAPRPLHPASLLRLAFTLLLLATPELFLSPARRPEHSAAGPAGPLSPARFPSGGADAAVLGKRGDGRGWRAWEERDALPGQRGPRVRLPPRAQADFESPDTDEDGDAAARMLPRQIATKLIVPTQGPRTTRGTTAVGPVTTRPGPFSRPVIATRIPPVGGTTAGPRTTRRTTTRRTSRRTTRSATRRTTRRLTRSVTTTKRVPIIASRIFVSTRRTTRRLTRTRTKTTSTTSFTSTSVTATSSTSLTSSTTSFTSSTTSFTSSTSETPTSTASRSQTQTPLPNQLPMMSAAPSASLAVPGAGGTTPGSPGGPLTPPGPTSPAAEQAGRRRASSSASASPNTPRKLSSANAEMHAAAVQAAQQHIEEHGGMSPQEYEHLLRDVENLLPAHHHVHHIIPLALGGTDHVDNYTHSTREHHKMLRSLPDPWDGVALTAWDVGITKITKAVERARATGRYSGPEPDALFDRGRDVAREERKRQQRRESFQDVSPTK